MAVVKVKAGATQAGGLLVLPLPPGGVFCDGEPGPGEFAGGWNVPVLGGWELPVFGGGVNPVFGGCDAPVLGGIELPVLGGGEPPAAGGWEAPVTCAEHKPVPSTRTSAIGMIFPINNQGKILECNRTY